MDIVQIIHQVTQDANKTQKPPPGRPRLDAQHIHSSLPGYVQLMHECWAQFPNERPSTDQCVQQLEAIQLALRGSVYGSNNYHQQRPTAPYQAQMEQQVMHALSAAALCRFTIHKTNHFSFNLTI
jgi:hypothetical protein